MGVPLLPYSTLPKILHRVVVNTQIHSRLRNFNAPWEFNLWPAGFAGHETRPKDRRSQLKDYLLDPPFSCRATDTRWPSSLAARPKFGKV